MQSILARHDNWGSFSGSTNRISPGAIEAFSGTSGISHDEHAQIGGKAALRAPQRNRTRARPRAPFEASLALISTKLARVGRNVTRNTCGRPIKFEGTLGRHATWSNSTVGNDLRPFHGHREFKGLVRASRAT